MLADRYDLLISTTSSAARDALVRGVDLLLSADSGSVEHLQAAILHDPALAVAHAALARALLAHARADEARAALAAAEQYAAGISERERSHVAAVGVLLRGPAPEALAAVTRHVSQWPRDAVVLQPAAGVFGLVGFSGRSGREQELHDLLAALAPHYGEDWWFDSALAFAEIEIGEVTRGLQRVDRSLSRAPRNANAAHIKAHAHYEAGEQQAGLAFLESWLPGYSPASVLHCHLNWHVALWALEAGDTERGWRVYQDCMSPDAAWGPALNVLTDTASYAFRAELAGVEPPPGTWRQLSDYADRWFPTPGTAFADVHASLAHAMAGDGARLARVTEGAAGPAADVVLPLAHGLAAIARQDWQAAVDHLMPVLDQHERVGGSRAQRDMIEHALALALLRTGEAAAARRVLVRRERYRLAGIHPVAGL